MIPMKLVVCVLGIYACYLSYGVFQESIFKYRAADGSRFTQTLFLLLVQCVVNFTVALVGSLGTRSFAGRPPATAFATVSGAYVGAMLCSNEALKMVSYPTQALAKSCKMIPVMLMGVLFYKKRYSLQKYICVALITAGIVVFRLSSVKSGGEESGNAGLALLFGSLALDGVVGPLQEKLVAQHKPGVYTMMMLNNFWAVIYMFVACVATDQLHSGMAFITANPVIGWDLALFSVSSAFGQSFIFLTIQSFSALVCTTITTTRKFFTILISVWWLGNPLDQQQWAGVALVFVALGWELLAKYQAAGKGKSA